MTKKAILFSKKVVLKSTLNKFITIDYRLSKDSNSLDPYVEIFRSVMEQKENFDDVTDESQPSIREMTFSSVKKISVVLFVNQTTKDMERFCTRLASSKYFSLVTTDDT